MVSDYRTIFLSDAYRPETFDIHNICLCLVRPTGFEPVTPGLKVRCSKPTELRARLIICEPVCQRTKYITYI